MARPSPNRNLVSCAACGHTCIRDYSILPLEDTPPEKIFIRMGDRRISLYCTNPSCNSFTIYCTSTKERDSLIERYEGSK
jgi:hypothetical protein